MNSLTSTRLEVAVFSFNRGDYLRNCVESVRRNIPFAKIRIFDDLSDDVDVLEYLESCNEEVIKPSAIGVSKHGGLYSNMQNALDTSAADYILFLQDDVQLVRPVAQEEFSEISAKFPADHGFMSVSFVKGARAKKYQRIYDWNSEHSLFRATSSSSDENERDIHCYFDVGLCRVSTVRQAGWRFASSERENMVAAAKQFGPISLVRDPFVFFCPQVRFFRQRRPSLSGRLAARFVNGPVFFEDMAPDLVGRLKARPDGVLPVAEDWLTPNLPGVRRPFVYQDARARWWLDAIYGVERHFLK